MGFETIKLFLTTNISDVCLLHELGNYLLVPGLFLWGGKNITILNTKQLAVDNILSLKERDWKSPLVWLKTAMAIILVIPSTILGAACKGLSICLSTNLRQNYQWVALNIAQKTEERIEDYSILDPSFFESELTDKAAFEQRTVNKPFLRSILIFLLSEENVISWGLTEERQKIAEELDVNEFKKALNFFIYDYHALQRLFFLLSDEKILDLGQDPHWKPFLLWIIPNDEKKVTNFTKCLTIKDIIEIFDLRGFEVYNETNYLKRTLFLYPKHLFTYLFKAIPRENEQINYAVFLAHFQVITPKDFFSIIHCDAPWLLGYAFYPLQAYLASKNINSIERFANLVGSTDFHLSEERVRSIFSFSKFALWMKECDQLKSTNEQGKWLAAQVREPDPDNLLLGMYESAVYYFIFLRKLLEYDLQNGCRVINRYLKEEDRKLLFQAFPQFQIKLPSLYDIALHQVHQTNLNRNTLNQDIISDLEDLDRLEREAGSSLD